MKFRLEHETVGFEYKIDDNALLSVFNSLFLMLADNYKELPSAWKILAQSAARAIIGILQAHEMKFEIKRGDDPILLLARIIPTSCVELGVFNDAILTFRVSETNESPTITDIQLQL